MPNALASENTTVFWWKGNTSPPKSYEKWADLIKNFVLHFQERYGKEEIATLYFEVWNEPDITSFYQKSIEEYFKLYKYTAEAIKSISSNYRVGGPASAIPYAYEEKFLDWAGNNHIPVDFIAAHAYGVKIGYFDEFGDRGTVLDPDKTVVRKRMIHSRELIKSSKLPNLELHFTEWSSSYTPLTIFMIPICKRRTRIGKFNMINLASRSVKQRFLIYFVLCEWIIGTFKVNFLHEI